MENNKKKTVQICALVIFIIFISIAVGSSTASVVLFLFNPIQQVHFSVFLFESHYDKYCRLQNPKWRIQMISKY